MRRNLELVSRILNQLEKLSDPDDLEYVRSKVEQRLGDVRHLPAEPDKQS